MPRSMQPEVTRQLPIVGEFMLHLAGQDVTHVHPTLKTEAEKFSFELVLQYQKALRS